MSSSLAAAARPRLVPRAGPATWLAADLAPSDWMIPLGQEAAAELDAALAALGGRRPERAAELPLPTLAPVIADLRERIEHGRGFALLRGLPFDRHGAAGAEALLLALGLHLGVPLPQVAAAEGGPVTHHASARADEAGDVSPFHADLCDAVALLCLRQPPASGASALISAAMVHNALMKRDRAALEVLYRPLPQAAGGAAPTERPVFVVTGGAFSARYDRESIEAAARIAAGRPLDDAQRAALDALDAVCGDASLPLRIETRPGDLLCFNPHLVWKRRMRPAPADAPDATREFLRLRLLTANSRAAAVAGGGQG
jgi:hypothetical protein